jgi:hypothetical protein
MSKIEGCQWLHGIQVAGEIMPSTKQGTLHTGPALASPVNLNTAVSFGIGRIGMDHDGPPSFRYVRSSPIRQTFRCPIPSQLADLAA